MSFDQADQTHELTVFPSKTADYTAIEIPILVWGPPHSSAVRWEEDLPDGPSTIAESEPNQLHAKISELLADPTAAIRRAQVSVEAGKRYFDLSVAKRQFEAAIIGDSETNSNEY